jgi:TusA-related sulfurtransferase
MILDCLGRPCPVPIIELAKAFPSVEVGAVVTVLSDDPAAEPDLRAWCRMREQSYEGRSSSDPHAFLIRRLS